MAYIDLGVDEQKFPGLSGLMRFRPETAKPIGELSDLLLRAPNSLAPGDRELIGAYVSGLNDCSFCRDSHSMFAAAQLDEGLSLVQQVLADPDTAPISPKLRALLRIAGAVQLSGREVTPEMIDAARSEGATDMEIHDTVLIAAAFSMANRYVDGLGTFAPEGLHHYEDAAKGIVAAGYSASLVPADRT
ncbi:MAG: carboxymuconolactone decarboxylase family protein [Catenulispora sp.]|nr:carboxymuconolactone decarboxylase family protein [Catenulispora sp.]